MFKQNRLASMIVKMFLISGLIFTKHFSLILCLNQLQGRLVTCYRLFFLS